jgi:DNA-binding NtrC family response regulator
MTYRALRILITDADADSANWLRLQLEARGHDARVAMDAGTEELLCHVWRADLVLMDQAPSDVDALTRLRRLRQRADMPHVILVSDRATVRTTVDALEAGAMSVLEKPIDASLLEPLLARVSEERYGRSPSVADGEIEQLGGLVSCDAAMRRLFETVRTAAPTSVNVLIEGENGTGKELVASALHDLSPRAAAPFIRVNCAAIPAELLESELFGSMRGAFTGAVADRKGLFELAHRGSILLDEIGEMPSTLQAKLLRVLQDREFRAVGGNTPIRSDFRLICATNVDAGAAVADGRLRQDLYFRLNTIALHVPPLRDRIGDIRLLATRFLERLAAEYGKRLVGFAEPAMRVLENHAWPGNVRELEHVVERAVILAHADHIRAEDLPDTLRSRDGHRRSFDVRLPAGCSLVEVERLAILQTLELTRWNKRAAAKILGIHRPTLYNKLRKYGLWRREDRFRRETASAIG